MMRNSLIAIISLGACQSLAYPPWQSDTTSPYEPEYTQPSYDHGNPNWHPKPGYSPGGDRKQRAAAVVDAFRFAWRGYSTYCFGQDELHPVTDTCSNSRNGWGASAVDALSTALVMEQWDIVTQITNFIPDIDFSHSVEGITVSLFETTIRYIGGMLSGYDLLTGPLKNYHKVPQKNVQALLTQAKTLADNLKYAFDTPSGVPYNNLWINNNSVAAGQLTNGLATVGTLVLEWQHLSDLTGDLEYGRLAQKGENYILNPSPPQNVPFPGLTGTNLNISNGLFADADGSWNGGDDSAYEYLIKMYVYDNDKYANYRARWQEAADSAIKYLASHPSSRPDLTFLNAWSGRHLLNESQHLTCFDGGNFILGGSVLGRQDYLNFGLDLVNGCHDTYIEDATGIGPEQFSWNITNLPANQTTFYDRAGFYITNSLYDLRPEVLESYYYAYRVTGDTKYQDWAWDGFQSIIAATKAKSGYSEISDVNSANPLGGEKEDFQESFLFAEVMKYAYLIFSSDAEWQVDYHGKNYFVFNTEAHPFRVRGTPV